MENIFQAEADAQNLVSGGRKNIKRMLAKDKPKQRTETNFPFFGHGKTASEIGITDNSLLLKESSVECPKMKNRQATPINKDVIIRYSPNACFRRHRKHQTVYRVQHCVGRILVSDKMAIPNLKCVGFENPTYGMVFRQALRGSDSYRYPLENADEPPAFSQDAYKPIIPTQMLCAARGWPIPCISRRSILKL